MPCMVEKNPFAKVQGCFFGALISFNGVGVFMRLPMVMCRRLGMRCIVVAMNAAFQLENTIRLFLHNPLYPALATATGSSTEPLELCTTSVSP